jgi:heavy metal sensor kinase
VTLTLRTRLAAISAIVFGLMLAAFGFASYGVLARRLDADASARLAQLADGLHGYLRVAKGAPSIEFDENDADQTAFVHEATRYYQVYDLATGRLLAESNGFAPLGVQLTPVEVQRFRSQPTPFDIQTEYGRLRVSTSVRTTSDHQGYLLQVGVSLVSIDGALGRYRDQLLLSVPLALAVAVLAVWWLSGFALLPLSRMATAADRIDANALDRRLPTRGVDDELDRVADAFNKTLGRLEHSVGEMRQFSAALAHELRTPLTALRGEIELAMRRPEVNDGDHRAFASQVEEIDRLTRLIHHILTLARAESGQIPLTFAAVNVGDLAASLVEQLEPMAQARSIDLRCVHSDVTVGRGDAGWLERMLLNLIDNALKYTNEGGRVVVRVSREGDMARIDVEDTGIGLSAEDAPQVFERFFRADRARAGAAEGAGIGLSLVQWIAERHQGAVSVRSQPGRGSTFTVTLPLDA